MSRPEVSLNDAPPYAPRGAQRAAPRASLMDTQLGPPRVGPAGGLGLEAGNPAIMVMEHIAEVEKRLNALAGLVPQLAPAFQQLTQALQLAVTQAMADQVAGVPPGAGAGMGGSAGMMGGPGMGVAAPSAPPTAPAGAPPMPV